MRYVSTEEMKAVDKSAIEDFKIPGIVLMENAVIKILKHMPKSESYLVVAGTGNNGGDALGVGRQLFLLDRKVKFVIIGNASKIRGDAKTNYEIVREIVKAKSSISESLLEIEDEKSEKLESLKSLVKESGVVIDGIFGTGLSSEVRGIYREAISIVNEFSKYTVSVDIPSGLNGDSGKANGIAVKADKTVALQYPKIGFKDSEAESYTGELIVEEISIPRWI